MRLERREDTASTQRWQEIYGGIENFYAENLAFPAESLAASYSSATFQDNPASECQSAVVFHRQVIY